MSYQQSASHSCRPLLTTVPDYCGKSTNDQHGATQHRKTGPSPLALLSLYDNPLKNKTTLNLKWLRKVMSGRVLEE